jgi:hypothetical protein
MSAILNQARSRFLHFLLETCLTIDKDGIPSIADSSQKFSREASSRLVSKIGNARQGPKLPGQQAGSLFEDACLQFLQETFPKLELLRPGKWQIAKISSRKGLAIADYEQYFHLTDLDLLAKNNPSIAAAIGNDYTISPDIVITRMPEDDDFINSASVILDKKLEIRSPIRKSYNALPILHASVSCKWTIRSDRAQNSRSEALNLIRNRKGRTPHIVVITAEPTPSRISSIALGTGDIDCVYHFALHELIESVRETKNDEAENLLNIMIHGRRLKDISDLPLDLCI